MHSNTFSESVNKLVNMMNAFEKILNNIKTGEVDKNNIHEVSMCINDLKSNITS